MKASVFILCVVVLFVSATASAALVVETFTGTTIIQDTGKEATSSSTEWGVGYDDVKHLAVGQGMWIAAKPDTANAWDVAATGGDPGDNAKRTGGHSNNARGIAYVYHSSKDITGSQTISFDYKKTLGGINMACRIWGVQQPGADWGGCFLQQAGDAGATGDDYASRFRDKAGNRPADATLLKENITIGTATSWAETFLYPNFGTGYDWLIIAFASNNMTSGITAIDNVTIPEPATMALLSLGGLALLRKRK